MFRTIRPILLAAVAASLTACAPEGTTLFVPAPMHDMPVSRSAGIELAQANVLPPAPQQQPPTRHIAVTHGFILRLAGNAIAALQERHLAECEKLGCTVLNTRIDRQVEGRINASISVRVAPDRYPALAAVITAPPAEVVTKTERAEDVTVAVLDVDKRLEVKTTLRERLNAMLRDPGTKSAADLAAIEKELAQAQGDIEAAVAQREYLRTLTETVRVDISYDGRAVVVAGFDFSPIKRAIDGIAQSLISSMAAVMGFLAAAVPWLPVVALVLWGVRWGWRRWRRQSA